jgi:amphi-Trp domain-containing protein
MAKNFEYSRAASPKEIAEYLSALGAGLKRGEVSLESGERTLRLAPAQEIKLELKVTQKPHKGRIEIEIGWKRHIVVKASELRVEVGAHRRRAASTTTPSERSSGPAH